MRIFDVGGGDTPPAAQHRILTIPNAVTVLRLLAVPFIVVALNNGKFAVALILLVVFSATDWVDGYLARTLNQVSKLGAVLDPAVDRIFIVAVALALFASGVVPLWAVLIVVVRDAGVFVLACALMLRGVAAPPVSKLGKAGSFAVMVAALAVVGAEATSGSVATLLSGVAVSTFVIGVTAGYLATIGYARAVQASVH